MEGAERFNEIMSHLVPILERNGWQLIGAYQTQIGRLWECSDIWEVDRADHVGSVLEASSHDPEFREWASLLPECVEDEESCATSRSCPTPIDATVIDGEMRAADRWSVDLVWKYPGQTLDGCRSRIVN